MKKILIILLLSVVSCAHTVKITSDPSGAKVYINNKYIGITPLVIDEEYSSFEEYSLQITKENFKEVKRTVIANNIFTDSRIIPSFLSAGLLLSGIYSQNILFSLSGLISYPVLGMFTGALADHYHYLLPMTDGTTKLSVSNLLLNGYYSKDTKFPINFQTKRIVDSVGNTKKIVELYRGFSMEAGAGKLFSNVGNFSILNYDIDYLFSQYSVNAGVGVIASRINNSMETGIKLTVGKVYSILNDFNDKKSDFSFGLNYELMMSNISFSVISSYLRLDYKIAPVGTVFLKTDIGFLVSEQGNGMFIKPVIGFRVLF